MVDYKQYIEIVLRKHGGKPCIKGTRITVYDVLGWMARGILFMISRNYPKNRLKHVWLMPRARRRIHLSLAREAHF